MIMNMPFFVSNTGHSNEKIARRYEKRVNRENYIKEAKYNKSVGGLLLKSFWANKGGFSTDVADI